LISRLVIGHFLINTCNHFKEIAARKVEILTVHFSLDVNSNYNWTVKISTFIATN